MKKQTKIIVGILAVVVLAIGAVALFSPSVFTGNASGTFAKADKYSKAQMTEKDVQLRSELTADTARLKSMLQSLVFFAVFTEDLCKQIDTCVNQFQQSGMKEGDQGYQPLMLLRDYASFIRNNNETLGKTILMLNSFYSPDEVDQSIDIEKGLREFGNYVKLVTEKDEVLESSLKGMDNFLASNTVIRDRKEEINKLKAVRDQLVIRSLRYASLVSDKALGSFLVGAMNLGVTQLEQSIHSNQGDLNAVCSNGSDLNVIELDGMVGYSQTDLSFCFMGRQDLNVVAPAATGNLQVATFGSNGSINVTLPATVLQGGYTAHPMGLIDGLNFQALGSSSTLNNLVMNSIGAVNAVVSANGSMNFSSALSGLSDWIN